MTDKKRTAAAGFAGFMGTVGAFAIADALRDRVEGGVNQAIDYVIGGIKGLLGTVGTGLERSVQVMFQVLITPFTAILDVLDALFGGIVEGISRIFSFDFGLTAAEFGLAPSYSAGQTSGGEAVAGPFGAPTIMWGIIGIFLAGLGIGIIRATSYPILGRLTNGVGTFFIITGAMIGAWGFFPELSRLLFASLFAVVFAIAAWSYMSTVRSITNTQV